MDSVLRLTEAGLFCEAGDFYVDPWRPVDRAVITHAHSDHARWGMRHYLCSEDGLGVLQARMGPDAKINTLPYGESRRVGDAQISFHPAGHLLGSIQVRIEAHGYIAVVSGDYKTEPDKTCRAFEPVRCHLFVTESTFGLPIYRWPAQRETFAEINAWWAGNAHRGVASVLFCYALGKAQRLLAGVDPNIGPIVLHGALNAMTDCYRQAGVQLPGTMSVSDAKSGFDWGQCLVLAPPSAAGAPWMRRFGDASTAFASGWMAIRGARRRRALDRGFVVSDHVDWPSLLGAVAETQAEHIWVTHGYSSAVARYLREERGLDAVALETAFRGETADDEAPAGEKSP